MSIEVRQILTMLLEKSRAGNVEWLDANKSGVLPSEYKEDYVVVLPESTINLYRPDERRPQIALNILNSDGDVVVSLFEADLDSADSSKLRELFDAAKFKVLKVGSTLDSILQQLQSPGKTGKVVEKKPSDDDIPF